MKTGIPLGNYEDDLTHTSSSIFDHVEKMTNMEADLSSSSTPNEVEEPKRSKLAKVVKDFGRDFITCNVEDEPLTFCQAMDSSESRHWKCVVKSEIDSIVYNGTYKCKARLVAEGFRQREGIDYFDTYSPVARMTTIRMLIAVAPVHGLIIHQMDVKTVFLHGHLEEKIYMDQPEEFVASNNERKDMGDASVILGIKLTQSTGGITLSQSHYIEKSIVGKYGYSNCRIAARYTSCPNKSHWEALDRVLRYLKGTISLGLHYRRFSGVLEGYSDASWIAKKFGSNGVTGYVFTLAGGAVSWKSFRRALITQFTFEDELCALDATMMEAEWLHGLMSMLHVVSKPLPAIYAHCDIHSTIDTIISVKYNAKTKRHIQVRLKSIRGLVSDMILAIEFVGTQDNIADPLTKGLEHVVVLKSRLGMGLIDLLVFYTGSDIAASHHNARRDLTASANPDPGASGSYSSANSDPRLINVYSSKSEPPRVRETITQIALRPDPSRGMAWRGGGDARIGYLLPRIDASVYSYNSVAQFSDYLEAIMTSTLVQSTYFASSVAVRRNVQNIRSERTRRSVKMMSTLRTVPLRMTSFSGLRGVNSLDTLVKSGQDFHSKVAAATSIRRGRACRTVPKAMFERFTEKAIKVIMLAQEEARRLGHNFVGTEQILLGLIGEGTGIAAKVLKSMGINLKDARVEVEKIIGRGSGFVAVEIPFTPRAKRVLELSLEEARQLGHNYIGSEHLLLGLLREGEGVAARVFENLGADPNNIRTQVIRMVGESQEAGAVVGGGSSNNKMPTLEEYGTNLTKLAEEGKLDPVVGRQPQIERVTQILGRRTKNNPCLVGEPGVGKTAIAEGLAQRIANGDVPETLEGKKVITLDMGLLVAGTKYRGEFEERLKKLMDEIKQADDIILFIDEVHTLIGAGAAEGAIDAANILKPALARGELQCIGATTLDEYRKHIEKDPALERRFQPVKVPEPSVDETIQILKGLRERYEIHHKLRYTDEALESAAQLSYQYISDRFLPDKAIDLIDEAGSRVRLRHAQLPEEARELEKELRQITKEKNEAVRGQDFEKAGELRDREMDLRTQITALVEKNKEMSKAETETGDEGPVVTEVDIQHIVASWTGIPVDKVSTDESDRLLKMEETLHTRVIGQDEAVKAISRAIRRARVGLKNPNRPIASFIFSGPTGVGKSELAKSLAAYYFGSEEAMIRLDMSEFMERHTVSKLIGSPPGYVGYTEGGQLTEAVRRRPYTVVLFDEIEKAHPDVFNMMLQILEDGRLTDSKGRTVDFKNTLLIMTSNVGSSVIEKGGRRIGFDLDYDEKDSSYNRIKSLVTEELKQYFRPEFLNRLDEMIVFRQLTKLEVKEIADIMLKEVFERLKGKEIELQVTERFRDRVVDEGYNPSYGARPLRRAIMRLLEDSMAEKMLAREIKEGDSVIVDVDSDGNVTVLNGSSGAPPESLPEPIAV
ncbi:hypothetical protein AgCh_015420 [Apium graveolens]